MKKFFFMGGFFGVSAQESEGVFPSGRLSYSGYRKPSPWYESEVLGNIYNNRINFTFRSTMTFSTFEAENCSSNSLNWGESLWIISTSSTLFHFLICAHRRTAIALRISACVTSVQDFLLITGKCLYTPLSI